MAYWNILGKGIFAGSKVLSGAASVQPPWAGTGPAVWSYLSLCLGKDRDLCKRFVSLDTNALIIVSLQSLLLFVRSWH